MKEKLLEIKNLSVAFKYEGKFIPQLRDVSFDVYKGEIVEALEDCSQTELMIISQTVMDLKRNLRKNIGVDDEEGRVG